MAKIAGPYVMPDAHAAMIGRIADAWALLEFEIDRGIWHLLGDEQQLAACITAQMISIHPRMRALIALVEVRSSDEKSAGELKTFYGKVLSGMAERRNRAVHDPRMIDRDTLHVHRLEITAKPTVQFGFLQETTDSQRSFHDEIHAAINTLVKMRDKAISAVEALPPESLPRLTSILPLQKSASDQGDASLEKS